MSKGKQADGEGSIYKRESDGRYVEALTYRTRKRGRANGRCVLRQDPCRSPCQDARAQRPVRGMPAGRRLEATVVAMPDPLGGDHTRRERPHANPHGSRNGRGGSPRQTVQQLKDAKRSHIRVHGRTGETCPVCGDTVREVSFADSALQYCQTRQKKGKILADRRDLPLPNIGASRIGRRHRNPLHWRLPANTIQGHLSTVPEGVVSRCEC